jgi:hypothetical protein
MSKLMTVVLAALALLAGAATRASPVLADEGEVDLLLVLASDVSRSVDDRKHRLQRDGYAAAIVDPRVVRAMMAGPSGRIAVCFVEWASEFEQEVVVDWAPIANNGDAEEVSKRIRDASRSFWGRTSISSAIDYSVQRLARSPFQSARRVIDVSGDGTNNHGRDVTLARDAAIAQGITINGLVILSETPLPSNPGHTHPPGGLTAYYQNNVVGGPGAFVMEAQGFESFGQLLVAKLVKEIAQAVPPRRRS